MSTEKEREENTEKLFYIVDKICGDNIDAKNYLLGIGKTARLVDDVVDNDADIFSQDCYSVIKFFLIDLPRNSFYLDHRLELDAINAVIWNAWRDSDILDNGDETDKIYAHVLRDFINELAPFVALVLHGYDKMREISLETRILFKKQLGD